MKVTYKVPKQLAGSLSSGQSWAVGGGWCCQATKKSWEFSC